MHWTSHATLTALALVGTIGAINSVLSGEWDAFVLFLLVVLLTLPLATSLDRSRRLVLLRNDLARWGTTGEPAGAIVDRAVARHRERIEAVAESAPDGHQDRSGNDEGATRCAAARNRGGGSSDGSGRPTGGIRGDSSGRAELSDR